MANAYPEDEVGDVEAPEDGAVDAGYADVVDDLVSPGIEEQTRQEARDEAAHDEARPRTAERPEERLLGSDVRDLGARRGRWSGGRHYSPPLR